MSRAAADVWSTLSPCQVGPRQNKTEEAITSAEDDDDDNNNDDDNDGGGGRIMLHPWHGGRRMVFSGREFGKKPHH